jgi:hypothetical protein
LYNVESVLVTEEENVETIGHNHNSEVRQRQSKAKPKTDNNRNSKRLKFVIKPATAYRRTFKGSSPFEGLADPPNREDLGDR